MKNSHTSRGAAYRSWRLAMVVGCGGFGMLALALYFLSAFYFQSTSPGYSSTYISSQNASASASKDHNSFILHPRAHTFRQPRTLRMTWNVTRDARAPDGVQKQVYLVNGEFPGPTIEARPGDHVEINVFNHVQNDTEGIAVHWHGLLMHGANLMDGAVGVTQCAIPYAHNYTYRFSLDKNQHGTFWYHAHSHVQRADGLYGGFIIHKPVDGPHVISDLSAHHYETEKLLMIGDWYHLPGRSILDWYQNPDHFGYEPAPDSLLVNGKGAYNCSKAVKARPVKCAVVDKPSLQLPLDERVRLRVINTGASAGYSIVIKYGSMRLITVDGGSLVSPETPVAKAIGLLHAGERIDLILDRTRPIQGGYEATNELTIELDRENMPLKNFALTRTQSFSLVDSASKSTIEAPTYEDGDGDLTPLHLADLQGVEVHRDAGVLREPAEKAVLYTSVQIRSSNHNQPVGIFNHTSWILTDSQAKPLLALDEQDWQRVTTQPSTMQKLNVPSFKMSKNQDTWMELVVNNVDDKGHPFHMHGHNFHVVLSQQARMGEYGAYNPFDPDSKHPDYPSAPFKPLLKDTVYVPPMGYVVLRFPLNNRGLWLMHCHVLWHQAVGMGIVFKIGEISPNVRQSAEKMCPR